MAEKPREEGSDPLGEISQGLQEGLSRAIDGYFAEHPDFSEVTDAEIDEILSRLKDQILWEKYLRCDPLGEISPGHQEGLRRAIDGYLAEHPGFSEVTDVEVDEILSRLIEKGADLDPAVKRSLHKAARFLLGLRLKQED